jgi:protein ImuB
LALRRFRPEREIEVLLDGGAVPRAISGDGIAGSVWVAAGPYRVSGEWWMDGGFSRDYWDVHASDGALYRIYRDGEGRWFASGYYD